jgi:hypothetical protein
MALDNESLEFHKELAQDYIAKLESSGVTEPEKYFEQVNAFTNGRIVEKEDVREFLKSEDLPLESFYRVAPTCSQDVMMATLNPGMQNSLSLSTFTDGEYARQHEVGGDLEGKAAKVAANLDGFLTHSDNMFRDLIDGLRSELDLMDGSGSLEDYLDCSEESPRDGFFEDVCYTWMYKLATPDDSYISGLGGPSKSEARKWFAEEIFDVVEPKVLVCVGKDGWKTVWNYLDNPEEDIEAYSEESPVTDSYHPKLENGAYSGLYRIESEDLWVITTWHASYWVKSDRLRRNAQKLNEELSA